MSLKFLHQVIIFAGFVISLIFAFWCFTDASVAGTTTFIIAGVAAIAVAIGFIAYEIYFLKKTRRLILN